MSDDKRTDDKKPIKDEQLDKVNAGYVLEGPFTPIKKAPLPVHHPRGGMQPD